MRATEMLEREPLYTILQQTLENHWSQEIGGTVRVDFSRPARGQEWRFHPLLNGFFAGQQRVEVREFMRDSFRHTPVVWRSLFQYMLGSALATRTGLALTSAPAFRVIPEIPNSANFLIVPGNRRIRVYDFGVGRVRVMRKEGFPDDHMRREIECRRDPDTPLAVRLAEWSDTGDWFEEPIINAYAFPRLPRRARNPELLDHALTAVEAWSELRQQPVSGSNYVDSLADCAHALLKTLGYRYPHIMTAGLDALLALLRDVAAEQEVIRVGPTHGDLQPGNVLVEKGSGKVYVIDWEHSSPRASGYDRMVLELNSRHAHGLAARISHFMRQRTASDPAAQCSDGTRAQRAAVFLLEDVRWFLEESLLGGLSHVPVGLLHYLNEVPELMAAFRSRPSR